MRRISRTVCQQQEDHTFMPEGYVERSLWADEMMKTHKQVKCKGCGLYVIWEPKP